MGWISDESFLWTRWAFPGEVGNHCKLWVRECSKESRKIKWESRRSGERLCDNELRTAEEGRHWWEAETRLDSFEPCFGCIDSVKTDDSRVRFQALLLWVWKVWN